MDVNSDYETIMSGVYLRNTRVCSFIDHCAPYCLPIPYVELYQRFDIRRFGAIGDGFTNDTQSIQNAIYAAREFANSSVGQFTGAWYQDHAQQFTKKTKTTGYSKTYQNRDLPPTSREIAFPSANLVEKAKAQLAYVDYPTKDKTLANLARFESDNDQFPAPRISCEVIIPPGEYLISTINLVSGMRLVIQRGARLNAIPYKNYYEPFNNNLPLDKQEHTGLINIKDCSDIEICGRGIINCAGDRIRQHNKTHFRLCNIMARDSQRIVLRDTTCDRAHYCNAFFLNCDDVIMDCFQAHDSFDKHGSGIMLNDCRHVLMHGCLIYGKNMKIGIGVNFNGLKASDSPSIFISDTSIYQGPKIMVTNGKYGASRSIEGQDEAEPTVETEAQAKAKAKEFAKAQEQVKAKNNTKAQA